MNQYLIFRTDRIGDFLLSMILIKNIKRNDKKAFIVVVCSPKNYNYIKTFDSIDRFRELDLSSLVSGLYVVEVNSLIGKNIKKTQVYKIVKN